MPRLSESICLSCQSVLWRMAVNYDLILRMWLRQAYMNQASWLRIASEIFSSISSIAACSFQDILQTCWSAVDSPTDCIEQNQYSLSNYPMLQESHRPHQSTPFQGQLSANIYHQDMLDPYRNLEENLEENPQGNPQENPYQIGGQIPTTPAQQLRFEEEERPPSSRKAAAACLPNIPAFDCTKLLEMQLKLSKRRVGSTAAEIVKGKITDRESRVHQEEVLHAQSQYFIGSPSRIEGKEKKVDQTEKTDRKDKNASRRRIPQSKDDLAPLEKLDQYRLMKIRGGEVKSNVDRLRYQLQGEYFRDKVRTKFNVEDIVTDGYYSITHPKTKQASNFVRQIQKKRTMERSEYNQMMSSKMQEIERQRLLELQRQEQIRLERKEHLKEQYERKLIQKMQQREADKLKKEQYKEWIKVYQRERPLEDQKEEEFRVKVMIPELEEQHKKLMTIKAERRPIDPEELQTHEQKYLDFKKDDRIRKRAELETLQEEQEANQEQLANRLYKGKYRYMALQAMLEQHNTVDVREIELSKRERKQAYAEYIRGHHQQTLSRRELEGDTISNQKFIRRVRNLNGSLTVSQQDETHSLVQSERGRKASLQIREEGIQNLQYVKNKVREQREREQQHPLAIQIIDQLVVDQPKSVLQQFRERRGSRKGKSLAQEIKEVSVHNIQHIDLLKSKAQQLDSSVKRKELLAKYQTGPHVQAKMEDELVNVVKAKLQLMNSYD